MASTEAQIKDLQKKLQKQFGILTNKKSMTALGKFLVVDMQKRIRLGYGAPKDLGKRQSFKSLKDHTTAYKNFRKRNRSKLDSTTSPGKQNLTFTGQLVRDLRLIDSSKANFTVGHSDKNRKNEDISNQELSGFVQDIGRVYMNVTDLEFKRLTRFYQNKIIRPTLSKI